MFLLVTPPPSRKSDHTTDYSDIWAIFVKDQTLKNNKYLIIQIKYKPILFMFQMLNVYYSAQEMTRANPECALEYTNNEMPHA